MRHHARGNIYSMQVAIRAIRRPYIVLKNPPEWLECHCVSCTKIRQMVTGGTPHVPVCTKCGRLLISRNTPPRVLEDCPECPKEIEDVPTE